MGTFENIPNQVLKTFSGICDNVLQKIWNSTIFGEQDFPQNMKWANITPVYKKKNPTLAENYRPVSVLPTFSKVFERIIQKQLSIHVERFHSPYLCGYTKGFSTYLALISLIEKWMEKVSW